MRDMGGRFALSTKNGIDSVQEPGTKQSSNSNDSPLVSVVMPVLDPHPIYFRQSIQSLLSQSLENIEIIIVEDPSLHTAKDLLDSINDPRIRYYANPQRTSLIQQRNRGLAEARAEYVAMQDADDIAENDRMKKQLEFLTTHPTIGVLGTQMRVIDTKGDHLGYRGYPIDNESIISAMRLFNPIAQPTVMFRKQVVLAAGGYQYATCPVNEDYELWCRLALREVKFSNHLEALLRYRIHSEATKITKLHEMIRGTLEIKKMYWLKTMDLGARTRMWMEYLLLWLPPKVILSLFMKTQILSKLPTDSNPPE